MVRLAAQVACPFNDGIALGARPDAFQNVSRHADAGVFPE
jgi:hypothetical protein